MRAYIHACVHNSDGILRLACFRLTGCVYVQTTETAEVTAEMLASSAEPVDEPAAAAESDTSDDLIPGTPPSGTCA